MDDYLDVISSFAARTAYVDIPVAAREAAKLVLLDTLGGMLASSVLPESEGFARLATSSSPGQPCTLVGFEHSASARYAAMVNATTACSFETDEGNRLGGGHPAIHVVPAALARAEELHASGEQLLTSLTVAYEVMSRLASGASARWPIHSHGTHGSPGSAVATVLYDRPDASRIRRIINLAACMSPATTWEACFDGGTVRNLYPAMSTFLGMLAVELDGIGYSGSNDGPTDVFGAIFGGGEYDTQRVVSGLGEQWRVTTNYFKLHFSCAFTHPPLDALFAILQQRPFSADEVERITVHGPRVATYLSGFMPSNMLAAKFNIPFALAVAVVRRSTGIESFLDEARTDPAINALASRVEVIPDPAKEPRAYGDLGTSLVTVYLRGGDVLTQEVAIPRGDALNPADSSVLIDKFRRLAGLRLAPDAAERIIDLVLAIDRVADVTELGAALRPRVVAAKVG
jgi:2-methylcitrate dehydratase PrpD